MLFRELIAALSTVAFVGGAFVYVNASARLDDSARDCKEENRLSEFEQQS